METILVCEAYADIRLRNAYKAARKVSNGKIYLYDAD